VSLLFACRSALQVEHLSLKVYLSIREGSLQDYAQLKSWYFILEHPRVTGKINFGHSHLLCDAPVAKFFDIRLEI
jgi:hypothetical protein